jgi:hypothetical protein
MTKHDLKHALLAAEKKNPGPQVKVTVQCNSLTAVGHIAQFLDREWGIKKLQHKAGNEIVFETNGYRGSIILTDLRHEFVRGFESGQMEPIQ